MVPEKQKILIADDSEMNRTLLVEMLKDDFEIAEVENGAQALAALQENPGEFSLLLLDIVMPEIDGFEVLTYMQQCHWLDDTPVIMISSESSPAYINRAFDLGATDYISRPFDVSVVRRRVSNTMLLSKRQKQMMDFAMEQIYEKEKSNKLMISILSNIVEFRNGESGLHVMHINIITGMMLQCLLKKTDRYQLSKTDISLITTASALHDIGKISVPDEILNKPGRLTAEEFEIMKGHSMTGARMLDGLPEEQRNTPLVRVAYQICRWHHERYDGGGYPDGLKGEEIPISAQVVSLADVYDALTSERCYKKAIPHEQAIQMILGGQCGVFNPLLLECLKEISKNLKSELLNNYQEDYGVKDMANIAEQMHSHKMYSSERFLRQLEIERKKVQFITSVSDDMIFSFTVMPPILNLNRRMAEEFGLSETIADPMRKDVLNRLMSAEIQETLLAKIQKATSASPAVTMDLPIGISGTVHWYQMSANTIWNSDHSTVYEGIVGKLTDVDEHYQKQKESADLLLQKSRNMLDREKEENGEMHMSGREVWIMMQYLQMVFDEVRLVDAGINYQYKVGEDGKMRRLSYQCYEMWNRCKRCENCISAKCFHQKGKLEKFEFIENETYHVVAMYMEIDGVPYSLEMLNRITDETLWSAKGKEKWVKSIFEHNQKIYIDSVSGLYNRRYYDEQLSELCSVQALVMLDIDNFKMINDSYGHQTGDAALHMIAQAVKSCVRSSDAVVRYGGDEFVIVLWDIPKNIFERKLAEIQKKVKELRMDDMDGLSFSVSIGGIYGKGKIAELLAKADKNMYRAKRTKGEIFIGILAEEDEEKENETTL